MIFLDNASTTRVFDGAAQKMATVFTQDYFNPSALYAPSLRVKNLIEEARRTLAGKLNADKNEIYFTSCATESNNWVLQKGIKNKKGNLVVSKGEHASVYESAIALKSKGIEVREVDLLPDGRLDLDDLDKKTDENTALVSIIHCSNETGAINDIAKISAIAKAKNNKALVHSDGVQAFLKLKTDVKRLGVDFYTVTAHKVGGPKGCAALYINSKTSIGALIEGGGQESGKRSGTENTPGMAGFAEAAACFSRLYDEKKIRTIHDYLHGELTKAGWLYNGCFEQNSGFILSLSNPKIKSEVLQHMLEDEGVLIGLGSACSSKKSFNRVLAAMGRSGKEIEGNIRISLCVNTTMDEAIIIAQKIKSITEKLWNKLS